MTTPSNQTKERLSCYSTSYIRRSARRSLGAIGCQRPACILARPLCSTVLVLSPDISAVSTGRAGVSALGHLGKLAARQGPPRVHRHWNKHPEGHRVDDYGAQRHYPCYARPSHPGKHLLARDLGFTRRHAASCDRNGVGQTSPRVIFSSPSTNSTSARTPASERNSCAGR